nr:CFI-box-CTERM domain-containing protein [uncultured Flavobacterium sp.]
MSKSINCPSCGAANQLLDAKNSKFCAFCGNSIDTSISDNKESISAIKSKPKIGPFHSLELRSRGIYSIEELIPWFSDSKLQEIESLDLSGNNISSLKGLEKFTHASKIILSNNKFRDISDSDLKIINNMYLTYFRQKIYIELDDNDFENYHWMDKIDVDKIINTYEGRISQDKNIKITWDKEDNNASFGIYAGNNISIEKNHPLNIFEKAKLPQKTGCFIATATMGSYEHPTVMELRYFRDYWILQKSWGYGFVQWYYHYGGVAAKFIEKSFILKMISYLCIVKPFFYLSRILKK